MHRLSKGEARARRGGPSGRSDPHCQARFVLAPVRWRSRLVFDPRLESARARDVLAGLERAS